MYKSICIALLACCALAALCSCSSSNTQEGVLRLGTQAGYAPFETVDATGQVVGFDIDLAQAIADKLGLKLQLLQGHFDSLIMGVKQGKYDLIMAGMSITPDRKKEITMIPYYGESTTSMALCYWNTPEEEQLPLTLLKNPTISVMVGTWMEEYLKSVPGLQVRALENNTDLIMEIQYGKSTAALFEPSIAQLLQQRLPQLSLVDSPLPKSWHVYGVGIGVKQDNIELQESISQALADLKADGTLQALQDKWFGGQTS